jgi:hypothetical protein
MRCAVAGSQLTAVSDAEPAALAAFRHVEKQFAERPSAADHSLLV